MKTFLWKGVVALAFSLSAGLLARISPYMSSHLSGYELLDRLEAYGCMAPTFRAFKPQPFVDLRDALINREDSPCKAPEWLLKEGNALAILPTPGELRARTLLLYADAIALTGLDASVTPLIPFNAGLPVYDGANLYLEVAAYGAGGDKLGLAFGAIAGWDVGLEEYQYLNGRFYLREGYAKLGYGLLELTAGRLQLKFGDAEHGDLALSLAFRPLDQLKLSLRPHAIGGLEFLGPFTFESWIAGLGKSAFVEDSSLLGLSLGLRPFSWLEIALMEVFQFGGVGPGVELLSASDFFSMLFYADSPGLAARRQRSFSTQIGIWGPSHFVKIYQQFQFDQLNNFDTWFADDISILTGLWFPNLFQFDLRLEYAHTVPSAYQNPIWKQGLSSEHSPFGHPLGPGGQGLYVDVGFPAWLGVRSKINLAYERRGQSLTAATPEDRYTFGATLEKRWDKIHIEGKAACSVIGNRSYILANDQQNCALQAMLGYQIY